MDHNFFDFFGRHAVIKNEFQSVAAVGVPLISLVTALEEAYHVLVYSQNECQSAIRGISIRLSKVLHWRQLLINIVEFCYGMT